MNRREHEMNDMANEDRRSLSPARTFCTRITPFASQRNTKSFNEPNSSRQRRRGTNGANDSGQCFFTHSNSAVSELAKSRKRFRFRSQDCVSKLLRDELQ